MSLICDRLDDYLAGELDSQQTEAFRLHLADCAACREEVRFQESINRLLRQATACETPPGLLTRLEQKVEAASRRKRLTAVASITIAASLLAAFVLRRTDRPEVDPRSENKVVRVPSTALVDAAQKQDVGLVLMDGSTDLLVVPQESHQPNVTIFWLYPTIKTAAPASLTPEGARTPRSES
jgi:hypothetical protein